MQSNMKFNHIGTIRCLITIMSEIFVKVDRLLSFSSNASTKQPLIIIVIEKFNVIRFKINKVKIYFYLSIETYHNTDIKFIREFTDTLHPTVMSYSSTRFLGNP